MRDVIESIVNKSSLVLVSVSQVCDGTKNSDRPRDYNHKALRRVHGVADQ